LDTGPHRTPVHTNDPSFDLTGDGNVNQADLNEWLAEAGAAELVSGSPYLPGDANLDGTVDNPEFLAWNANKFDSNNGWCGGDFNADGITDGPDFLIWNANKFTSADNHLASVPEPATWAMLLAGLGGLRPIRHRK
jgi:hypothetical protein